jgi:DNA-binding HxlR family transcriptional regulator
MQDLAMQDQDFGPANCPVEEGVRLLTGKWRMMVLFRLKDGPQRFNALQRSLAPITQKVLTATLRGLEADGLVWRRSTGQVPPEVHYGLTPEAEALAPVFAALAEWRLARRGAA